MDSFTYFLSLNSQNKVVCDWKEEEIVNLKWVALCNKTDVISHYL